MRLARIEIDAFGSRGEVVLGPFSSNLIVIHAPTGTGAATIPAFIRSMLVGLPEPGLQAAREVTAAGSYSGRLILQTPEEHSYIVERCLTTPDAAVRVVGSDGELGGEASLAALLTGLSPELYLALFAFGPAELCPSGVHINGHARSTEPGDNGDITQTLRDLEAVERELDAARPQELNDRRAALSRELRDAIRRLAAIKRFERRIAMETRRLQAIGPEDMYAWRRTIDELRESWTRLQALQRMHEVYQQTVNRQRIPRSPWFLVGLTLGVMLPVVLGAVTGHDVILSLGIASALLGMITLLLAAVARSRFESAQLQALLHLEMTHREAQGRFLHAALRARIVPERVTEEIERLEADFNHVLERRAQLESAAAQRAEAWRTLAVELELPAAQAGSPESARVAAQERVRELRREQERLDAQLQPADGDRRAKALRAQRRKLLTLLEARAATWLNQLAGDALPGETPGVHHQPELLRAASELFDAMTLGAYHQLLAPRGSGGLVALGRDGGQTSLGALPSGRREQAHLALRIALLQAFGAAGRSLPVLVEDFLAGFEREQAAEALRSLNRLTADQQVFIFTRETATVALARRVVPDAEIVTIGSRKVASLAPRWSDND